MQYHDNYVYFSASSLSVAKFTTTALSIPDEQDPEHRNKPGQSYEGSGSNAALKFEVGRHKTSSVGQWWNDNIKANQNTFGHNASELNFAFLGTLQLTYNDADGEHTYHFSDIGLAQGSSGSTNNWWFGGKNCTWADGHMVITSSEDSTGVKRVFRFHRGGDGHDQTVSVTRD